MKYTLITAFKAIYLLITLVSIVTMAALVILLSMKPGLAIEFIERYLIKQEPIEQIELAGIGVLGDSQSDEYRADDNRGVNYPTSTYNWVEILEKNRNLNFGTWGYHEEPRRQGYEYNFARSGATAKTMIDQGQHTGLAEYVKTGKVNTVVIYIGANDFAPYLYDNAYSSIYNDEMSREQIIQKENEIVASIQTAVETLHSAGDVQIFLVTIPDWGNHTAVKIGFPLPHHRYKVTKVIHETNTKLSQMAEEYGAEVIEINEFYQSIRGNDTDYQVKVGDVILEQYVGQNNPKNLFLRDGIHPGTVLNSLFANYLIDELNIRLKSPVEKLTTDEIISISGLR